QQQLARGFKAIKMGWRPFGRVSRQLDELLVRTARETVGDEVELMVDAGASEQFWPHSVGWARDTARMLGDYGVTWFEEALKPDDIDGFVELKQSSPVLIATGVPYIEEIIEQPFALDADGTLRIPTGPGLGITLNRDAIARFSPK